MINPVNRFFKAIEDKYKELKSLGLDSFWSRTFIDYPIEDLEQLENGIWITKEIVQSAKSKIAGIFRVEHSYCVAGRPCYTQSDSYKLFNNSETEKVMYEFGGLEFVWKWTEVRMPTDTCWGMKPDGLVYEIRDEEYSYIESKYKSNLQRWWKQYKNNYV